MRDQTRRSSQYGIPYQEIPNIVVLTQYIGLDKIRARRRGESKTHTEGIRSAFGPIFFSSSPSYTESSPVHGQYTGAVYVLWQPLQ